MNTDANSIYAHSGVRHTLGATGLTETARADITPGFLALLRCVFSVVAKTFDGIAGQRDRQAKQIIACYGYDRCSDALERKIKGAAFGKGTRL